MNKKGFTLIELLIVVAIIGLLSTLAVVSLGSARVKARDSKRLSDLKQIQTALELYYTDQNSYPTGTNVNLGEDSAVCLNSEATFQAANCANPYMGSVPADPKDFHYVYNAATASSSYTIAAELEGNVNGLTGTITLSPAGIAD